MILSDTVPTLRSDWGNILSPENLVPDGFIIILWLLLWDHNVVVPPFLRIAIWQPTRWLPSSPVGFWSIAVPINFISTYSQFCKSCFPLAFTTSPCVLITSG
jgi:hypothetical protein